MASLGHGSDKCPLRLFESGRDVSVVTLVGSYSHGSFEWECNLGTLEPWNVRCHGRRTKRRQAWFASGKNDTVAGLGGLVIFDEKSN